MRLSLGCRNQTYIHHYITSISKHASWTNTDVDTGGICCMPKHQPSVQPRLRPVGMNCTQWSHCLGGSTTKNANRLSKYAGDILICLINCLWVYTVKQANLAMGTLKRKGKTHSVQVKRCNMSMVLNWLALSSISDSISGSSIQSLHPYGI